MLEHILVIAMFCQGIHISTREGMILGFVQQNTHNKSGELHSSILKVITECDCCMVSFWGLIYFSVFGLLDHDVGFVFIMLVNALMFFDVIKKVKNINYLYLLLWMVVVFISDQPNILFYSIISACGVNYAICRMS